MTSGKRKKVLIQTDFSLAKTGFGRNAKAILTYLYSLDKYDLVHYCCGRIEDDPDLSRTPWKSIGTIPTDPFELDDINKIKNGSKMASYGFTRLDKVVYEEKPDVYIAIQDIWGIDFAASKPWFKKITSAFWTTLDSLPLMPETIEIVKKVKNFWVWSHFAEEELHRLGHAHVKTFHGPLESKYFFNMKEEDKKNIRKSFRIPEETFVLGFVFRNQLRKSVPNLLKGYKIWKEKYEPKRPTAILLHTSFSEGWDILERAEELGVDKKEILCTYVCSQCGNYEVNNFLGEKAPCPFCNKKDGLSTASPRNGVTEEQLNEIYNLMNVYVHPFTSGGQEIPIQEAKLTELITLVTNYSCGTDMCVPEAFSYPLDWAEYREPDTEFIKASTYPESIAEGLHGVYSLPKDEKSKREKMARDWTLENYSVESIGKTLEEFIDEAPLTKYKFSQKQERKKINIEDSLSKEDKGKRILYVMPGTERDVFLSTSLFKSIREQYPEYNLYVATEKVFFSMLDANPYVHKVIQYSDQMENIFWLEGRGTHKGYFEIAFLPHINTQKIINFTHNGKTKIAYDLKK